MKGKTIIATGAVVMAIITAATLGLVNRNDNTSPTTEPTHEYQSTEPDTSAQPTTYSEQEPEHYWEGSDPDFTGYPEPPYNESDIEMIAKTVWGEAGICHKDEQRLVIWTILQRVDADKFGDTIAEVVTAPSQFVGYKDNHPVKPEIYALCAAELADWWHGAEPPTMEPYAPTTPYYFFDGDGRHNWYREVWK